MPPGHPVAERALETLARADEEGPPGSGLRGHERNALAQALLEGPYAAGPIPEPLAAALGAEAADAAGQQWGGDQLSARLIDVLGRYTNSPDPDGDSNDDLSSLLVPAPLADGVWTSGLAKPREALLSHPGVPGEMKQEWLRALDVPSLANLLRPGTPQDVVALAVGEAGRRTPTDTTYTWERSQKMAVPETLLSLAAVDASALPGLVALLPRDLERGQGETSQEALLRSRWRDLVTWIARMQAHLWADVTDGDLLLRRQVRGRDGKEVELTDAEKERLGHIADVTIAWMGCLTTTLDRMPDATLQGAVTAELNNAAKRHRLATWWTSLPEDFDPSRDGGAVGEVAFQQWVATRADAFPEPTSEPGEEEHAEELASREKHLRWSWEHELQKSPAENAMSDRWSCIRYVEALLPVLTGKPEPAPRPQMPGEAPHLRGYEYEHRRGWAASKDVLDEARLQARGAVHEFLLPHPPAPDRYEAEGWMKVAAAALATEEDRAHVPAEVLVGVHEAARAGLVRARMKGGGVSSRSAAAQLMDVTALARPATEPLVQAAQGARPNTREAAREVLDMVRRDTTGPGGGPSVTVVDDALEEAVTNTSLDVDEVLALAPGLGKDALADALARLALRLETVVRAHRSPVSATVRATAVQSVLRSRYVSGPALLALPAFAVFSPDSRLDRRPTSLSGSGGPARDEPPGVVRRLLLDLVDPTGADADAWTRLAEQDVTNQGRQAWRTVRAVLADAGIEVDAVGSVHAHPDNPR